MEFSRFGERFTRKSGILQLMDDLGSALSSDQPVKMLGGGNPAAIAEVNAAFQSVLAHLAEDPAGMQSLANYSNPQGDSKMIAALASFFQRHYGWDIQAENIALTNGSQNAFFYLFNLFAGDYGAGVSKKILLPLVPEYVGYNDVQVGGDYFTATRPTIERVTHNGQEGFFKYRLDMDAVSEHPDLRAGRVGAICVSRPTNPTGNVLTDAEMAALSGLAKVQRIPLIIDNAYGMPFPNIVHTPATLCWNENTILCMSLSKIGLPGVRTGVVIARPEVIAAIRALNAIVNLAPTRFGAAIATPLLENDQLKALSDQVIQPFYRDKAERAIAILQREGADLPLRIHQPEGAIFLWLWFENLPIPTLELYARLKARGTLIIPGEYFFPGLETSTYPHARQCIRMSIAAEDHVLAAGIADILDEVRRCYH